MFQKKFSAESFVSTRQFPENFLLGTATTAFQVEGAWNEGKLPHHLFSYFLNFSTTIIIIYLCFNIIIYSLK